MTCVDKLQYLRFKDSISTCNEIYHFLCIKCSKSDVYFTLGAARLHQTQTRRRKQVYRVGHRADGRAELGPPEHPGAGRRTRRGLVPLSKGPTQPRVHWSAQTRTSKPSAPGPHAAERQPQPRQALRDEAPSTSKLTASWKPRTRAHPGFEPGPLAPEASIIPLD